MKVVFWSPFQTENTKQNIKVFAKICRTFYGLQVRVFGNHRKIYGKLHTKTEQRWDMVFIECGDSKDVYAKALLKNADMVVISFPQDFRVITEYFLEHHTIMGNVLYLINSHPINPKDNRKILIHTYRLNEEEIGIISYSEEKKSLHSKETRQAVEKLLKMNCLFS